MLRTSSSLSRPWPLRSCRRKSKPPTAASSGIGGGLTAKTKACLMRKKVMFALRTSEVDFESAPGRLSQSLRRTKAMAAFWPRPKNEKPSTPITCSTSGCLR